MQRGFSNEKPVFGGAFRQAHERASIPGVIARVNPKQGSCDVSAGGNYYGNVPLPNLARDVDGAGGEFSIPRRGTPVVLRLDVGWPTISQILPISTDQEAVSRPSFPLDPSGTSGGELFPDDDGPTFLGRLPKDMHMGDRGWVGNQGQKLAILEGGVVSMEASPMARVDVVQEEDTLIMAGRNARLMTGFGNVEFHDEGGKSWFVFEGGTDQLTQTGAGRGDWTIRAEIGGEASGLVDFVTQDLTGQRTSSMSIDMDGSERRYYAGNSALSVDGLQEISVRQGRNIYIQQGNDYLEVQGAREERVYGNYITETFDTRFSRVGGDRRDTVMRDWSLATMRNMKISASGDIASAIPYVTNALDVTVTNGSVTFDVGNPLAGDAGGASSSFRVSTHAAGNIELIANEIGMLMLDAVNPMGSVYIGANISPNPLTVKNPAFEPAVLGTRFMALMQAVIETFDSHVHVLPPLLAYIGGSLTTLIPTTFMKATVAPNVPFSISKKVMVGL